MDDEDFFTGLGLGVVLLFALAVLLGIPGCLGYNLGLDKGVNLGKEELTNMVKADLVYQDLAEWYLEGSDVHWRWKDNKSEELFLPEKVK